MYLLKRTPLLRSPWTHAPPGFQYAPLREYPGLQPQGLRYPILLTSKPTCLIVPVPRPTQKLMNFPPALLLRSPSTRFVPLKWHCASLLLEMTRPSRAMAPFLFPKASQA